MKKSYIIIGLLIAGLITFTNRPIEADNARTPASTLIIKTRVAYVYVLGEYTELDVVVARVTRSSNAPAVPKDANFCQVAAELQDMGYEMILLGDGGRQEWIFNRGPRH